MRIAALCNSCCKAEKVQQGKQNGGVIFGQRLSKDARLIIGNYQQHYVELVVFFTMQIASRLLLYAHQDAVRGKHHDYYHNEYKPRFSHERQDTVVCCFIDLMERSVETKITTYGPPLMVLVLNKLLALRD